MTTSDVQENVFISGTVLLAAAGWWIANSFKHWSIASIIAFFPSSSLAMQSSNTAQNRCGLLIVDDVWNMNPGRRWDGMMSWIEAKSSCTYFERSRVPFLKVGYLLLVEILTSLAKKKTCRERMSINVWLHWMHLLATISLSAIRAVQRLRDFLLSIRLKARLSVHTFLTNISCDLRGQHNMNEAFTK